MLNGPRTVGKSTLLHALADRLARNERLASAVVLYTGALTYRFDDGTLVLPLDTLWLNTQ